MVAVVSVPLDENESQSKPQSNLGNHGGVLVEGREYNKKRCGGVRRSQDRRVAKASLEKSLIIVNTGNSKGNYAALGWCCDPPVMVDSDVAIR